MVKSSPSTNLNLLLVVKPLHVEGIGNESA
jgi:hypothetical protein